MLPIYSPDIAAFPNQADFRISSNLFAPGNGLVRFDNFIIQQVPEPGTFVLAGHGCRRIALPVRRRYMA